MQDELNLNDLGDFGGFDEFAELEDVAKFHEKFGELRAFSQLVK